MRYFLDTEFIERGPRFPIELISIALVADDDREMYLIADDWDADHASFWVRENVIAQLDASTLRCNRLALQQHILDFISTPKPEIWGWYADYDWVLFCQIFGTMLDLPRHFPRYCLDVKQLVHGSDVRLPKQTAGSHNALADARHIRDMYRFLQQDHQGERL